MRSRNAVLVFFKIGGLFFMAVGVVVALIAVPADGTTAMGPLIAGSTFGFIGLTWYVVSVAVTRYYRRTAEAHAADRRLFETGQRAEGVIENVEKTNTYINEMPVVYVTVRVTPKFGSPFSHTEKIVTPSSALPVPGQRIAVAFDPSDHANIALDTVPGFMGLPGVVLRTRPGDAADSTVPPAESDDHLDRLERLAKLHKAGVLTDAEFAEEKARLLGGAERSP